MTDELRPAYGIELDALGLPAEPLEAARCKCERPQVAFDDYGDRRCIRCGREPRKVGHTLPTSSRGRGK